MTFAELLSRPIFGNSPRAWIAALAIFCLGLPALLATRHFLAKHFVALAARTPLALDDLLADLLGNTSGVFLALLALFGASLPLALPDDSRHKVQQLVAAGLILQLGSWGGQAIRFALARHAQREGSQGTVTAIAFLAKLVLWVLVALLLLDNFGLQVTALITTLGVSGIAVALAAQSVLGDLFAAISIYLDKPFLIGDFIIVDNYLGTVTAVGLRSTRIASLSGEQIVMSNSDLLKSRVRNYKQMRERRVVFRFGIRYGTPTQALAELSGAVRAAIEAQPRTRFDRAHLASFGESSIDYEVVYYVLSPDYNVYMDTQQAINLALLRHLEAKAISFAHPIRMVGWANGGDPAGAKRGGGA